MLCIIDCEIWNFPRYFYYTHSRKYLLSHRVVAYKSLESPKGKNWNQDAFFLALEPKTLRKSQKLIFLGPKNEPKKALPQGQVGNFLIADLVFLAPKK